jgi:hypothetical protein
MVVGGGIGCRRYLAVKEELGDFFNILSSSTTEATWPPRSYAGKAVTSQPPLRRLVILVAGAQRILSTKWCIPDGLEMTCDSGSLPEGSQ